MNRTTTTSQCLAVCHVKRARAEQKNRVDHNFVTVMK